MTEKEPFLSIPLEIAGLRVSLTTRDDALGQRLSERYAEFISETEDPIVTVTLDAVPGALFLTPEPGPWVIETSYRGNRLVFRSYQERGEVDLSSGRGVLEMAPEGNVENFLRALYAWLCVQNDALLLHAAGVIREGQGYVFFGPSGAGKTTSSRLAAKTSHVVSDDLVILRRDAKRWLLHGVPFRGEPSVAPRANLSAPLKGLFRLRQDTTHFVEPVPRAVAIAELVASAPFVVGEHSLTPALLAVCDRLARANPVQQLHFSRDDGFWRVIDGIPGHVSETTSPDGRQGY